VQDRCEDVHLVALERFLAEKNALELAAFGMRLAVHDEERAP